MSYIQPNKFDKCPKPKCGETGYLVQFTWTPNHVTCEYCGKSSTTNQILKQRNKMEKNNVTNI